jgi:hypothetical protein
MVVGNWRASGRLYSSRATLDSSIAMRPRRALMREAERLPVLIQSAVLTPLHWLSPASGVCTRLCLFTHLQCRERNLVGVAGERTLTKVRITPGLAAASRTRQIDDVSFLCAPRHACLSEDSPSQDIWSPQPVQSHRPVCVGTGRRHTPLGRWLLAVSLSSTAKLGSRANDWLRARDTGHSGCASARAESRAGAVRAPWDSACSLLASVLAVSAV